MKCIPHGRRAHSSAAPNHRRPVPRVVVVDARAGDYSAWQAAASAGQVDLEVVPLAQDALRLSQTDAPDLWVVNAALADQSGFDLCAMLKQRSPRTPIYLVVDGYSVACERAAWQAQATMFVAKPGHNILLEHWLKTYEPSPALNSDSQATAARRNSSGVMHAHRFAGSRFAAQPHVRFDRRGGLTS